jgi:hypothetical protein
MNILDNSKELEEAAKAILNRGEVISEDYIEVMDSAMLEDGTASIKKAWKQWRNGPMTEKSDIKPAQKELKKYLDDWFKANIK